MIRMGKRFNDRQESLRLYQFLHFLVTLVILFATPEGHSATPSLGSPAFEHKQSVGRLLTDQNSVLWYITKNCESEIKTDCDFSVIGEKNTVFPSQKQTLSHLASTIRLVRRD